MTDVKGVTNEKNYQCILRRVNYLGGNDSRISSKFRQQIPLLEVIVELVAIQAVAVAAIIITYMTHEFFL